MKLLTNLGLLLLAITFSNCTNSQSNESSKKEKNASTSINESVDIEKAQALIKDKPEISILDLRTDEELKNGRIPDAVQINYNASDFQAKIKELDKSKPYLIYCHSGGRSGQTLKMMNEMGFSEVYEFKGGFNAWSSAGLPLEKKANEIMASEQEVADFETKISKEGFTFVNFYAEWCGVCKKNRPLLKTFSEKDKSITFLELDVDANKGLKNYYKVQSIPTLMIYKDGKLTEQKSGALSEDDINKMIQ